MFLYQGIVQNAKIEKDIVTLKKEKISSADARKSLQPSFDPSKDSYAIVTQTPSQSSRPLPPWAKKLPIDFMTEILKYILNYCLTRLDTLDEITSENPVPRNAPSSDETPPPPQTTLEQKNETTTPSTESALQSAASNDDENEIEMLTMSNKRPIHEDSSKEDPASPLPAKRLPLVPQLVGSLAPMCQKGGEGKIYLRSLPSLPTLPSLEDGDPVREISLPHGLPVSQTTQVRDLRVLPKVVEIAVQ